MPELVLRGVPLSLRQDAWWLGAMTLGEVPSPSGIPPAAPVGATRAGRRPPPALLLLLALTALADWLFWAHDTGISLVLFAAACLLAVAALSPHAGRRTWTRRAAIFIVAALPAIETVQLLSLGFLAAGTAALAGAQILGGDAARPLPALAARLLVSLPAAAAGEVAGIAQGMSRPAWRQVLSNWALPLTTGLIFTTLLTMANPIAEHWGENAASWLVEALSDLLRPVFWTAVALPIWPLLARDRLRARLQRPMFVAAPAMPHPGLGAFNPASVARSLVLFNLMFAVQTALDLRYLWSGAALPDGMTYAEYAHRGAYPLVATALLAGAFALASRPFIAGRRDLSALLTLWIGQNVLLVASSLYRLDLYVDSYGLTYLRARAAIWMALVAAGLATVAWQIARKKSNRWLITVNAMLLAATLYGASFVNFAGIIVRHNLTRGDAALDLDYLCTLGPDAAAALRLFEVDTGWRACAGTEADSGPVIEGWRDWGFRSWRIRRYLAATAMTDTGTDAGENSGR